MLQSNSDIDHIYIGSYIKNSIKTNILYYSESCAIIAQKLYKNINIELKLQKSFMISLGSFRYVTSILGNVYKINIYDDIIPDIEKDILNIIQTIKIRDKWINNETKLITTLIDDTYHMYFGEHFNNYNDNLLFIFSNTIENKLVVLDGSSKDFIYKPKRNFFGFKMNNNSEFIMFPTNDWKLLFTYKKIENINKVIEFFNNMDISNIKYPKNTIRDKFDAFKTLYLKN